MLKRVDQLRVPDPFYAGTVGFVGSTLEALHEDMRQLELPTATPDSIRRIHDAVRHAYIYSYYAYDLLTLAASEAFPCLELALRERIGDQFRGRVYKNGRSNPPKLDELLKAAKRQGLIASDITYLSDLRNLFLHGSETVLNPPMFLIQFQVITRIIQELYEPMG